jgi:hypothetical protein
MYPGHEYNGRMSSTIAEAKQWNERLTCRYPKQRLLKQ